MYNNYEEKRIGAVQGNNHCRMLDLFEKYVKPILGKMQNVTLQETVHFVNTVWKDWF
jgi:hypothetical protein